MRHSLPCSPRLVRAGAIVLLACALTVVPSTSSGEDATPNQDATIENRHQDGVSRVARPGGMRIHLDEDGRPATPPRAAPHISSRAAQTSQPAAPETEPLTQINAPGGGTLVILDGRFQPYSAAQIGPDGKVSVECRHSAEALHRRADDDHVHEDLPR